MVRVEWNKGAEDMSKVFVCKNTFVLAFLDSGKNIILLLFQKGKHSLNTTKYQFVQMHTLITSDLRSDFVHCHWGGVYHYAERLTSCSVCRERQEREEAEREGRQIQEEEPDDENMPSPFQPIGNVISEVCTDTEMNLKYILNIFETSLYFLWTQCFVTFAI